MFGFFEMMARRGIENPSACLRGTAMDVFKKLESDERILPEA